ncbi:MAG: hypothetical protein ACFFCO_03950 [Promethearchaeota archaeon]
MTERLVLFDVEPDGEIREITPDGDIKDELECTRVLLIVDDEEKRIWLWIGSSCGVRKKFIGARQAQAIRNQRSLVYKVISVESGDEPSEFQLLMGLSDPTEASETRIMA